MVTVIVMVIVITIIVIILFLFILLLLCYYYCYYYYYYYYYYYWYYLLLLLLLGRLILLLERIQAERLIFFDAHQFFFDAYAPASGVPGMLGTCRNIFESLLTTKVCFRVQRSLQRPDWQNLRLLNPKPRKPKAMNNKA